MGTFIGRARDAGIAPLSPQRDTSTAIQRAIQAEPTITTRETPTTIAPLVILELSQ
jgi:hypothetical protein